MAPIPKSFAQERASEEGSERACELGGGGGRRGEFVVFVSVVGSRKSKKGYGNNRVAHTAMATYKFQSIVETGNNLAPTNTKNFARSNVLLYHQCNAPGMSAQQLRVNQDHNRVQITRFAYIQTHTSLSLSLCVCLSVRVSVSRILLVCNKQDA